MTMRSPSDQEGPSGGHRTLNLTMATYLISQGFGYWLVRAGQNSKGVDLGAWVFDDTPALGIALDKFNEDTARVSPKLFHSTLTKVRKELYDYLQENKDENHRGTVRTAK